MNNTTKKKKYVGITRKLAKQRLEELVLRCLCANVNKNVLMLPYCVRSLYVFGSFTNTDKEHLGDLDILYHLEACPYNENKYLFTDIMDFYNSWYRVLGYYTFITPEGYFNKFLRNGKRCYSFHSLIAERELLAKPDFKYVKIIEDFKVVHADYEHLTKLPLYEHLHDLYNEFIQSQHKIQKHTYTFIP